MLVRPDDRGIDGMLLVSWRPKTRQDFECRVPHADLAPACEAPKTEFQLPYRWACSARARRCAEDLTDSEWRGAVQIAERGGGAERLHGRYSTPAGRVESSRYLLW
jgi:hypothetical protein